MRPLLVTFELILKKNTDNKEFDVDRDRSFEVGVVNIRVHTRHAPEEYFALWKTLFRGKRIAIHSNTAIMIGEARSTDKDDESAPIVGSFYKFLNIDPSQTWFDIARKKKADEDDVSQISIPDYLKPNLTEVPYIFYPKKHRLYFVSKEGGSGHAAPRTIMRMLKRITEDRAVLDRFGKVDVTVVMERAKLEEIYRWKVIKRLELVIERPNPLDYEDEEVMFEYLQGLGAESEQRVWKKARDSRTLQPDAQIKMLAVIASENGKVVASGLDDKLQKISVSSDNFPMMRRGKYSPNTQTLLGALQDLVVKYFM